MRDSRPDGARAAGRRRVRAPLREDDLVRRIRARLGRSRFPVLVGPGHDAALVAWPRGAGLVLKTDQVVAGVHFDPSRESLADAGYKALMRGVSDVAAFGGIPVAALVSAALPAGFTLREFDALFAGLRRASRASGAAIVGGDLSRTEGPLVVAVALAARATARRPKLRSGARPGDRVLVTGRLGGSRLGRHLRIAPRLRAGRELAAARGVHAMMDVSDGFLKDLSRLARESGLAAVVRPERVPVHADARRLARATGRSPIAHALGDGEDHEILFAAAPRAARALCRSGLEGGRLPVTDVGEFRRGRGVRLALANGKEISGAAAETGHEHVF